MMQFICSNGQLNCSIGAEAVPGPPEVPYWYTEKGARAGGLRPPLTALAAPQQAGSVAAPQLLVVPLHLLHLRGATATSFVCGGPPCPQYRL